jgi:two-component sensor histidine kinase
MGSALAQPNILTKEDKQVIENFQVLADRNYSFEKIISDSSLPFTKNPLLYNFKTNNCYWVKCTIENPLNYPAEYYLSVFPIIDDTLYFYNNEEKKWQAIASGLVNTNGSRSFAVFPVTIENNNKNIFYARLNVGALANFKDSTKVSLNLIMAAVIRQNNQFRLISLIITMVIILMLFLYNLYSYLIFKDKAFLYYLLILAGATLYILGVNKYFNALGSLPVYQVLLSKEGNLYYYNINSCCTDLAIIMVITGFIQFTRNYLQTRAILPQWDRVLKYTNITFAAMIAFTSVTTITGIWYSFIYFALAINISIIIILLFIIGAGVIAYRRKYMFGKYFLAANILPLFFMLLVAIYFIMYPTASDGAKLLPNIAILSLAFTFATALFFRITTLKKDLGNEQLQAQTLINNLNRAEQSNNEKEIILKEIHHRVKNNLQIINGLLFMQFKDNNDEKMKAQLKQSQERIKSMALVHNKLYESDSTVHVYIKEYIKDLAGDILKTNTPPGKSIQLNIEESEAVNLSLDTSVSLGLILNELITNSCKYAFANKENGQINIIINKQNNGYQLIVKDDGSGLADGFHQKNSMGLRLVTNLSKQLGGQAKFENNNGTVVTVNFVDAVAA